MSVEAECWNICKLIDAEYLEFSSSSSLSLSLSLSQGNFQGRLRHFLDVVDPRTLLTSKVCGYVCA